MLQHQSTFTQTERNIMRRLYRRKNCCKNNETIPEVKANVRVCDSFDAFLEIAPFVVLFKLLHIWLKLATFPAFCIKLYKDSSSKSSSSKSLPTISSPSLIATFSKPFVEVPSSCRLKIHFNKLEKLP